MDSSLVQRTRYQLQARVRWAKTCPPALFPNACRLLLNWIDSNPILQGLVTRLRETTEQFAERLAYDLAKDGTPAIKEVEGPYETSTRDESAAFAIAVLQHVQGMQFDRENLRRSYLVAYVLSGFDDKQTPGNLADAVRDVAVQSLYEYLDEQIDGRNAVLGLLLKYKSRSEMYRRHRLREAAVGGLEGRTGERALAFDLYEYLHDQGVDFSIESVSASGEPDLVASESSGQQLVADTKYINDSSDPRKVVGQGFRQVLDYCRDHNEPVGYLVVREPGSRAGSQGGS